MPYVITDPCVGTCDTACVRVCPVDAIHGPLPVEQIEALAPGERRSLQLYIDPVDCICCGACVPECPVEAIFDDVDVPAKWASSIDANARFYAARSLGAVNI